MAIADLGASLLRRMEPEQAHNLALAVLKLAPAGPPAPDDPVLSTRIGSLALPNPVGLAAGLDKNGVALRGLARLGFGFIECGSVTPRPQAGNPKPRLFRLSEDRAIINRMGFNNAGLEAFASRLQNRPKAVATGANLGANKDTEDRAADYVAGLSRLRGLADYVTVNVSSPNTPGLRALQGRASLDDLLGRLCEARGADPTPVFLKIAPDLEAAEISMIVEAALDHRLQALIVANTTLDRPASLQSNYRSESGGLSGAPLRLKARAALDAAVAASAGRLPIVAVGGVDSGEEAYQRIRAGACAVQIYSALVYEGPGLVGRIKRDLAARLRRDGFSSVVEAVGTAR